MPDVVVTASLAGVTVGGVIGTTDWVTQVRNKSEAASITRFPNDGENQVAFKVSLTSTRGTIAGQIRRTFLFFKDIDTAIGGGTITSVKLSISGSETFGESNTTQDSIIVSASAYGGDGSSDLALSDYSKLSFSDPYSSALTSWSNTGYNQYLLNSDAIADINADGYLNCVVINENNDFDGVSPILGHDTGSNATITSAIPAVLQVTFTAAATTTNVSVTQSIVVSSGDLSAGTPVTYSISNPLSASSYFVLETTRNADGFYDSNSPRNLQGTFTLGTGITDVVSDDYKAGVVVAPGGGDLIFTPTNNVTATTLLLIGTGA